MNTEVNPRHYHLSDPCNSTERFDYNIEYLFTFPNIEFGNLKLKFTCSTLNGKINIQSYNFLRHEKSDLPQNFLKKGLKLVDYKSIKKKAFKKISGSVYEEGELVIFQDHIYWIFTGIENIINQEGDAEMYIRHTVLVNPYNGKIYSEYSITH